MKLYSYFRSSAAYRVRIALAVKGLKYHTIGVNLLTRGQSAQDYKAVNPQGRVPTLIDGDLTISQSPAILEYLEEVYPLPALLPKDPAGRARVRQLMNIICCDIHPLNNLAPLGYLRKEFGADDGGIARWYMHWVREGFTAFEAHLRQSGAGTRCHGDSVTLADVCLVPQVYNAQRFKVPLDDYPLIRRIDETLRQMPTFQAAAPENQPDAPSSAAQ